MQQPERLIAVVGSGVVGTATGAGFAAKGHSVVFCDTNSQRVTLLLGRGYHAVRAAELPPLSASTYLVSVPTPTVEGQVDASFVREAARAVGKGIRYTNGHPLIVVRSTVPPGTTEGSVIPALEMASGRVAGV